MPKTLLERAEGLALRLTACASILLLVAAPGVASAATTLSKSLPGDHLEPGLQGQNLPEDLKLGILPQP
jgi:hypothetical protein